MNKNTVKQASALLGSIVKKIAESALHAAVFAGVSKTVSNWMTKMEKEEGKDKMRVEADTCCKNKAAPPVPTDQL